MREFIARQNIKHFRQLLSEARDATERKMLRQLLEEEEGKLAELTKKPDDKET